jgi:hypothetical protein
MVRSPESTWWRWLLYLLLGAALLWKLSFLGPQSDGDDALYAHALDTSTYLGWLEERRATWSGRTVIDAITLVLVHQVWCWRVLSMLAWLLMLGSIAHLSGCDRTPDRLGFVFVLPALMSAGVLAEAAWWMTGSFNYLWPAAAAWGLLLLFSQSPAQTRWLLLGLPAALVAGSHEQVGMVLLAFMGLMGLALVRRGAWQWSHGLLLLVVLLGLVSTLAAAGSVMRYTKLTMYLFPEYLEWHLDERLLAGAELGFSHFFSPQNPLAVVLLGLLAVSLFRHTRALVPRLLALIPLVLWVGGAVLVRLAPAADSVGGFGVQVWTFHREGLGYEPYGITHFDDAVNPAFYAHLFLVSMGVLCTGMGLWNLDLRGPGLRRWGAPLVLVAAFASTTLVGLSPSLYASSVRVMFVQDSLVVFLCALLFTRLSRGDRVCSLLGVLVLLGVYLL